jgi:ABC-type transport system involved in multi-copper enzyme maturation permease subunit
MLENTNWIGVLAMAAGGVAGLAMLAGVAVSLWKARSLVHKEFFSYFLSPIAYAVLVVFLGVQGWLVAGTLDLLLASGPRGVEWPLQFWLSSPVFWLVFLAACPLLTMRTFAEEKASGTLEMLMTSPLSDWQIVLAKYAGCLLFYTVLWLPTVVYLPVLGGVNVSWAGGLPHVVATADLAPVYTTYLGLFLAGAMFLAMGVCVSSMVRDQLVAAQASLALGVLFLAGSFAANAMDGGTGYQVAYYLSVPLHFDRAFSRGVIDLRPVTLYVSVALFSLFLTVRSLESRRYA